MASRQQQDIFLHIMHSANSFQTDIVGNLSGKCNNPKIWIQIKKFPYTWTPPVIHPPSFSLCCTSQLWRSPEAPRRACRRGGRSRFSGRQPLKPSELHSAVELLPPVPVLFAQQLKSTLGEPLVLMLSTFLRVREVSTLVLDHAAAGRTAPSPPCAASRLCTTSRPACTRTSAA